MLWQRLKLISIPTLKVLCTPILLYREDIPDNALLCPMIDARRMEVYTAIYDRALHEVVPTDAVIVNENSFAESLTNNRFSFSAMVPTNAATRSSIPTPIS